MREAWKRDSRDRRDSREMSEGGLPVAGFAYASLVAPYD